VRARKTRPIARNAFLQSGAPLRARPWLALERESPRIRPLHSRACRPRLRARRTGASRSRRRPFLKFLQNVLYFLDDLVQICARRKRGFPEALRGDPAKTRGKVEEKVQEDIATSGDPRGSLSILSAPGWHDPGLPSGSTDNHARMDFTSGRA